MFARIPEQCTEANDTDAETETTESASGSMGYVWDYIKMFRIISVCSWLINSCS